MPGSANLAVLIWPLLVLFIRVCAFSREPEKRRFFRQGWNVFDTLIVTVSLIPIDESERFTRTVDTDIPRYVWFDYSGCYSGEFVAARVAANGYVCPLTIIFYIYAAVGTSLSPVNRFWGDIALILRPYLG